MSTKPLKIMITGCSGVGKTTLAKWISETCEIPFISGSYSDLVPSTREETHQSMITKDPNVIRKQDMDLVRGRSVSLKDSTTYVTDRCYIDSMAYWINKLSHHTTTCDTNEFLDICNTLLSTQCNMVIYIPYTGLYHIEWAMEDNKKRVLNEWYQSQITAIMDYLLREKLNHKVVVNTKEYSYGTINSASVVIPILTIKTTNFHKRTAAFQAFTKIQEYMVSIERNDK